MANIASLLKTEIVRLARREVRKEVQALRKASATHRREIAALKRANAALERRAKQLARRAPSASKAEQEEPQSKNRFSAKGLRSMDTVWITGTLASLKTDSYMGAAGYRIEAQDVVPYGDGKK